MGTEAVFGDDGTTHNDLCRLTWRRSFANKKVVHEVGGVIQVVSREIERKRRQEKKIARIVQDAEAAQRRAKAGGWK